MEKTIRIFGKEKQLDNGVKFVSFSYTKDGEKFLQVKFNQACDNVPKTSGYWLITVDTEDVSLKKGKKLDNGNRANDILWVSNIIKKAKDAEYEAQVATKRKEELEEALG